MTVLGTNNEKADDKEKLVVKEDVATIMPNRGRLIKVKKRRLVLRIVLTIGIILILSAGVFLTLCFINKTGPFKRYFTVRYGEIYGTLNHPSVYDRDRRIRGFCGVGQRRYNNHKTVLESYEITDDYALINVPKFNTQWNHFQSVKTLHVFKKQVTVVQVNGVCFIRPMFKSQIQHNDWFEKIKIMKYHHTQPPRYFTHIHWKLMKPQLPENYLHEHIHHLAAAICQGRPVYRLNFFYHHVSFPNLCRHDCHGCNLNDQQYTRKIVNGVFCNVCTCKQPKKKNDESSIPFITRRTWNKPMPIPPKSRNDDKKGCKLVSCVSICDNHEEGKNCQPSCKCLIPEKPSVETGFGKVAPKDSETDGMKIFKNKFQPRPSHVVGGAPDSATPQTFVNVLQQKPVYDGAPNSATPPTFVNLVQPQPIFDAASGRNKRSAQDCRISETFFEGYTPLDQTNAGYIDYVHNC